MFRLTSPCSGERRSALRTGLAVWLMTAKRRCPGSDILVARLAREQDARGLAGEDDLGLHGPDLLPAGVLEQVVDRGELLELLEVLDGGEHEQDLAGAVRIERAPGREPAPVDDLLVVDLRLRPLLRADQEEVRVKAGPDLGGRDPARERDELVGIGGQARLLLELAHAGGPLGGLAVALVAADGAAREDPGAAHEPRVGVALDQEQL